LGDTAGEGIASGWMKSALRDTCNTGGGERDQSSGLTRTDRLGEPTLGRVHIYIYMYMYIHIYIYIELLKGQLGQEVAVGEYRRGGNSQRWDEVCLA